MPAQPFRLNFQTVYERAAERPVSRATFAFCAERRRAFIFFSQISSPVALSTATARPMR